MAALTQSNPWKIAQVTPSRQDFLIKKSGQTRVLGRFHQVFPLALFPDDLIIEEQRIAWVINKGPWTKEIISTMATDIASVDSSTGPLLGHIHVLSLTGGAEIIVDKLPKNDVLKARFLIEGIVIAARNGETIEKKNLELERGYLINRGKINE